MTSTQSSSTETGQPRWQALIAKYQSPDLRRSLWQLVNTLGSYLILWYLMYRSLEVSYWLTLLLAFPTAGFLMRAFIIFHDCGHGSFFKSNKYNDLVGTICGWLTLTPYYRWRHDHAIHHATSGDLDRRGTGDVPTMTVSEYLRASWWKRFGYRVVRNPLILFFVAPLLIFGVFQRFDFGQAGRRERMSVHYTNLALAVIVGAAWLTIGLKAFLMVYLPLVWLSSVAGVWMFYVQHQFEDTYWKNHPQWQYVPASLRGSSYYKLPRLFQWFTGNIGFHHVHHLSPRIPNYRLEKCHKENAFLREVTTISLWESFRTIRLKLWDEESQSMVGWGHLRTVTVANQ